MITREQIKTALNDDKTPFTTKGIDYKVTAISLLRNKIPYDVVKNIIAGAEHDVIYLVYVEEALPYLDESDLSVLANCNCWIDTGFDSLAMFV